MLAGASTTGERLRRTLVINRREMPVSFAQRHSPGAAGALCRRGRPALGGVLVLSVVSVAVAAKVVDPIAQRDAGTLQCPPLSAVVVPTVLPLLDSIIVLLASAIPAMSIEEALSCAGAVVVITGAASAAGAGAAAQVEKNRLHHRSCSARIRCRGRDGNCFEAPARFRYVQGTSW